MQIFPTAYAQAGAAAGQAASETSGGLSDFFGRFIANVPLWIAAGIVFFASFFIARILTYMVIARVTSTHKEELNQEVVILIRRAVYTATIILGLIISLEIVGISIATLLGFMGLGIGFAFQDLLADFIAGVVILTQKKFKIGDMVEISDYLGYITEIEARTTQVRALDGSNLIIPNSEMLKNTVRNYTANSFRRITVVVGVHYSDDLAHSVQTALEATKQAPQVVVKPEPKVIITEFSESSINLEVRFWIESTVFWPQVRSDVIASIKKAFDREGITIPFPIRTLALDTYDGNLKKALKLEDAPVSIPNINLG